MQRLYYMAAALILLASVAQAQVICPGEQPCPAGYHETAVNCKVCVLDGYDLTRPTDTDACPVGSWLTPDQQACCQNGTILKSDGKCCVFNESDPCPCREGFHWVAPHKCCPDGAELATDNPNCCKLGGGVCCATGLTFREDIGSCVPGKPAAIQVR
jgi:hypothetical protein